jgi:hypothetical protein
MVEEVVRGMSVETTAAIYGAVAGALVSGIFGIATLLVGRSLRKRGGVEFTVLGDWRSSYIEWHGEGHHVTPSRVIYKNVSYRRAESRHHAQYFVYAFTIELLNKMDVGAALRDVSVAFMKEGAELFRHRPFDQDALEDPSGVIVFEEAYRDISADLGESAKPPGEGIEPVGPIALPSHIPVAKKLKGYVGDPAGLVPDLLYLKGGCDEVRLRGVRENGKAFDKHITWLKP